MKPEMARRETDFTLGAVADLAVQSRIAAARLRDRTPPSPLILSRPISARFGCEVLLKCDHLLPSGSFKFRGGYNKLLSLSDSARAAGVVAASTGNHGRAIALAGREQGVPVTVHAPASASPAKLDAIVAEGAQLVLHDGDPLAVEIAARAMAADHNLTYVSPYNDLDVIAGQGGLAVEVLDQEPDIDAVVVSVGGGGLLSGVGAVLASTRPDVELIAAWPANAVSLLRSIEAGVVVEVDEQPTLSDATAGGVEPGSVTVPICRALRPTPVTVDEDRIAAAMRMLAEDEHWIVEGAAGVALAGLGANADRLRGKKVAVVICGRNISFARFLAAVS